MDRIKMKIEMEVTPAQGLALQAMFDYWNQLSSIGSSRKVSFYVDGDGDFHPNCKVTFKGNIPKLTDEIRKIAVVREKDGNRDYDYDVIGHKLSITSNSNFKIVKLLYKKGHKILAKKVEKVLSYSGFKLEKRFRNFVYEKLKSSINYNQQAIDKIKNKFNGKLPTKIETAWKRVDKDQNKVLEAVEKVLIDIQTPIERSSYFDLTQRTALTNSYDLINKAMDLFLEAASEFWELEPDFRNIVSKENIKNVDILFPKLHTSISQLKLIIKKMK